MVGNGAARIRVLVVDDAAESRAALRRALSFDERIDVVGEAGSGAQALRQADDLVPDVILMDVQMPDGNGVEATSAIHLRHPATRVIALTAHEDAETVREMLAAGAAGYVVKGTAIDDLAAAVRSAHAGEGPIDDRILPHVLDDLRRLLGEERQRRGEAERLARMREEFVHVLAHELRTPLTVMSGALRTVEQVVPREDVAALVRSALRRGDQLEHLIEGLELIGDPGDGNPQANPARAVRDASRKLEETPDRLDLRDEDWPTIPERHLTRVAYELTANALRHGRRPVSIEARREGGEGVLRVRDAGGTDVDPALFRPFVQEDMSTTRERGGMGLGLFVASRLCEAAGGTLRILRIDGETVAEARFPLRR
ncbi:MAG TPA: response regulator [Actinomycetota bacterium]|nr:response regulator [Actinomycetota bacterium]